MLEIQNYLMNWMLLLAIIKMNISYAFTPTI